MLTIQLASLLTIGIAVGSFFILLYFRKKRRQHTTLKKDAPIGSPPEHADRTKLLFDRPDTAQNAQSFALADNQNAEFSRNAGTLTAADREWLSRLEILIEIRISDSQLDVGRLAAAMFISERQLQRKLKRISGHSPVQYIREIRLQYARKILQEGRFDTISELSRTAGFNGISYFSKQFRERFGVSPSDFFLKQGR
jgi:AraC-like DNA-binding protein